MTPGDDRSEAGGDAEPRWLKGAVAVITGGAGTQSGLGGALVRRFASEGMRVAILDRDLPAARALAGELRHRDCEAIAYAADVLDPESLDAAAARIEADFGGCAVLCAHVGVSMIGPVDELPLSTWRQSLDLMVVGSVATVNAFLPLMRRTRGNRRIVLTSSAAALAPGRFQGPYRAAKTALTSYGETLQLELEEEGIGVTIAFPSGVLPPEVPGRSHADILASLPPHAARVTEEMTTDPSDFTIGTVAAAPIVEAIVRGDPYVVTHGVTVKQNYLTRAQAIDRAFDALARRSAAGEDPLRRQ